MVYVHTQHMHSVYIAHAHYCYGTLFFACCVYEIQKNVLETNRNLERCLYYEIPTWKWNKCIIGI